MSSIDVTSPTAITVSQRITETLKRHLHATSARVAEKLAVPRGSLTVDIGSSDHTVPQVFKNAAIRVLGVEPTNIAKIAVADGIPTVNQFFSVEVARAILAEHGPAAIVTAANGFAHVSRLSELLSGVRELLTDDGMFVTESHYMVDILETLQYDSIYHEHLRFYLLKPLQRLFDDHGFTLEDVERIPNYGGSIGCMRGRAAAARPRRTWPASWRSRSAWAVTTIGLRDFRVRTEASRQKLRSLIVRLDEGQRVAGIGCPGRAVTLLTYCGLTPDLLPYIAEQSTSLKLGLYTPGGTSRSSTRPACSRSSPVRADADLALRRADHQEPQGARPDLQDHHPAAGGDHRVTSDARFIGRRVLIVCPGVPHSRVGASTILFFHYIRGIAGTGCRAMLVLLADPSNFDENRLKEFLEETQDLPNLTTTVCRFDRLYGADRWLRPYVETLPAEVVTAAQRFTPRRSSASTCSRRRTHGKSAAARNRLRGSATSTSRRSGTTHFMTSASVRRPSSRCLWSR